MWNGCAIDVMRSEAFKQALSDLDVKFKLCLSDRPFNVMKDRDGTLLDWDRMSATTTQDIAAEEVKCSHASKAVFMSRVSTITLSHWEEAYGKANLIKKPRVITLREPKSVSMGAQVQLR